MIWGLGGECTPLLENTLARNTVPNGGQYSYNGDKN